MHIQHSNINDITILADKYKILSLFTLHADVHERRQRTYYRSQENEEDQQVAAQQPSPRTVELPLVSRVESQNPDPPAGRRTAGSPPQAKGAHCPGTARQRQVSLLRSAGAAHRHHHAHSQ